MRLRFAFTYLLFFQFMTPISVLAQSHDNNILQFIVRWDNTYGMAKLDIPSDMDTIIHEVLTTKYIASNSNICMSDSVGHFIFASNGLKVYDRNYNVMTNGDSISFPDQYSDFNAHLGATIDYSYYTKSTNAIPLPGKKDEYIFFHTTIYIDDLFRYQYALRYTRIDMKIDDGLVIEKNVLLSPNTTQLPLLIKHGNGIDWWLITAHGRSNTFYSYLINNDGIVGPMSMQVGTEMDSNLWYKGTYDFHDLKSSTDGSIILSQKENFFDLFSFDRCAGILDYLRKIDQSNIADNRIIGGSEISPSADYYYYSQGRNFFQVDLKATENPIVKLGHITSLSTPHISFIRIINDKFILGTYRVENIVLPYLALISEPDLPGPSCQLNLNMFYEFPIQSPVGIFGQIPSIPNYRLGNVENYSDENCKNVFFDRALEPVSEFIFHGSKYYPLIRKFKE